MNETQTDTEDWDDDDEEYEEYYEPEEILAQHLRSMPNWEEYVGEMYQSDGWFFSFDDEGIITVSSDTFTYGLRDCHSPTVFTGISEAEEKYIDAMMGRLGIGKDFFAKALNYYGAEDSREVETYFETEDEEKQNLEIYRTMKQEVESGITPFKSMNHFISAVSRYNIGSGYYYMWEGSVCSLDETWTYESVSLEETGLDIEDWIAILEKLDSCRCKCSVEVDNEYFVSSTF